MLNSNYKRYCFWSFFDFLFTFLSFGSIFLFNFLSDYSFLATFGIFGGLSLVCSCYNSIYFNKVYQFKKNAKKPFPKKNN